MDFWDISGLGGLAVSAFLAATPLPMNSEVVFIALQMAGQMPWLLILIASLANTAGSCVTFWCGAQANRLQGSRWFPFTDTGLEKASTWFRRWGSWSLLFSWVPGGDFLVAFAGFMRVNIWAFVTLTLIAKTSRYIGVAYLTAYASAKLAA